MATIIEEDNAEVVPEGIAVASAVEAARQEGATEVVAQQATQAAEEAKLAAEQAITAASGQAEVAASAAMAAAEANAASDSAQASLDAVVQAINAQNAALSELISELKTSRKSVPSESKPPTAAPETPPSKKAPWYYR